MSEARPESGSVIVRPYDPARDRDACLAIFRSNVPTFFGASEEADYAAFLEAPAGRYLVLHTPDGAIVAAGGYALDAQGLYALCWGMVDRRRHRRGLGRRLLQARLDAVRAEGRAAAVRLSTSQHACAFFARFGFIVVEAVPDGIAPGIDRVEMRLELR